MNHLTRPSSRMHIASISKQLSNSQTLVDRAFIVGSTYAYAWSILFAYQLYLFPLWGYFGFEYSQPTTYSYIFAFSVLTITSVALPKYFTRPSSVILLFMYAIVFIPTVVITLCLKPDALADYWKILLSLTLAIVICSVTSRLPLDRKLQAIGQPSPLFVKYFIVSWVLIATLNIATYHSIMGFAGIETAYEQREAGASKNALTAYSQAIFSSVVNPTIFVMGLIYRKKFLVWIGIVGSLIIYAISAQKTILILPVVIYLFYKFLSSNNPYLKTPAFPLFTLAVLNVIASLTYEDNEVAWLFSALFVFRTIAIPGLTFSQYHEFFHLHGYTFWSHVKGISLLIPAPSFYTENSLWPGLGYMIGESVYGRTDLNANANLFSGDGVAAAGWFGVLVIGFLFAVWIKALDFVAAKWDAKFTLLALMPLAISLTNGHFFTNLLSFGGLAWLIILFFFKPTY